MLPNKILELRATAVDDTLMYGNDPKFSDLQALMTREARNSESRFGKLASESPPQRSVRMPNSKQNSPKNHSDASPFNMI